MKYTYISPTKKTTTLFGIFLLVLMAILIFSLTFVSEKASALSGAEFTAGRIIDDGIFYNKDAMSPAQIQQFLNAKVPVCDTNHAQSGSANDSGPPYTCLKDYRQNTTHIAPSSGLCNGYSGAANESAAQIIYNVAQSCGINPQVILVMLQKEQGLITDTWPWEIQYRKAMGAFCPDTAPCDPAYAGFFYQVYYGAHRFKVYAANPNNYNYKAGRNNFILYNPNTACGGSNVFIENQATASLYIYTPYQPNPATLAVGLGVEAPCGAYGNKNFWWYFNIWFGPTREGEHFWRVIRTADDGRLFLQVGNTKRWIPTGEIYSDWTLDQYQVEVLSQADFDMIPTIPELTRLGTTGQYNYVVENGRKHYLPPNLVSLWNYSSVIAAPVGGLLRIIPENEPMGRFIKAPDQSFWLINGNVRHSLAASDLSAWGYANNNVVGIGATYLNSIPTASAVSRHIRFSNTDYVVDQGGLLRMPDSATSQAWAYSNYVSIGSTAPSFLANRGNANIFVQSSGSPHWFMLDDGTAFYVPSGSSAANWNLKGSPTSISSALFSGFASGGNLTNLAKDASNQNIYVLDGEKHYIGSGELLSTLTAQPSITTTISPELVNKLPTGADYTSPLVRVKGTAHVYLMDSGKLYHVSTSALLDAFSAWGSPQQLSPTFAYTLPGSSSPLRSVFKDSSDNYYLVDGGKKYAIASSYESLWSPVTALQLSDEITGLIPAAATTIATNYVRHSNNVYYLEKGTKIRIIPELADNYPGSNGAFIQANDTLASGHPMASFLLKSTDDQKVWFVNEGAKTEANFAQQVNYGHLSRGLQPAPASNIFLSSIPTSISPVSLLIRKADSWGVKFVNFGSSLGFPNGDTLSNYISGDNPIIVVDDWTYDQFALSGSVSRIIKDDSGKLYLLENGQRRWITNGNAYAPYRSIPITYLYGTTHAQIPLGAPIE